MLLPLHNNLAPEAVEVALTPTVIAVTAPAIVAAPQSVSITLTPATLGLAAIEIKTGAAVLLTPATLGLAAPSLTVAPQVATVALDPATARLTAVGLPATIESDAVSSSTVGTGTRTWNHTTHADAKAVAVYVITSENPASTDVTDEIGTVTFGGLSMTEAPNSPLLAVGDGSKRGVVHCFTLESDSLPSGTVEVVVTATGSVHSKHASAVTMKATGSAELLGTATYDSAATTEARASFVTGGRRTHSSWAMWNSSIFHAFYGYIAGHQGWVGSSPDFGDTVGLAAKLGPATFSTDDPEEGGITYTIGTPALSMIMAVFADAGVSLITTAPGSVNEAMGLATISLNAPAITTLSITEIAMTPATIALAAPSMTTDPGDATAAMPVAVLALDAPAIDPAAQPFELTADATDAVAHVPAAAIFDPSLIMAGGGHIVNASPDIVGDPAAPNPNPGSEAGWSGAEFGGAFFSYNYSHYYPNLGGKRASGDAPWSTIPAGNSQRSPVYWRDNVGGGIPNTDWGAVRHTGVPQRFGSFGKPGKGDAPFASCFTVKMDDPPIPAGSTVNFAALGALCLGKVGGDFQVDIAIMLPDGKWDAAPTTGWGEWDSDHTMAFNSGSPFSSGLAVGNNISVNLNGSGLHAFGGVGDGVNSFQPIERVGGVYTAESNNSINGCTLRLQRVGNPSGDLKVEVYATSGGLPTGAPLRTSGPRSCMGINNQNPGNEESFTWSSLSVTSGTKYAFVLRCTYPPSELNNIRVGIAQAGTGVPAGWGTGSGVDYNGLSYGLKESFGWTNYGAASNLPLLYFIDGTPAVTPATSIARVSGANIFGGSALISSAAVVGTYHPLGAFDGSFNTVIQEWIDHVSYVPGADVCFCVSGIKPTEGFVGFERSFADPILSVNWTPPATNYQLTADADNAVADAPATSEGYAIRRLTGTAADAEADAPATSDAAAGISQQNVTAADAVADAPGASDAAAGLSQQNATAADAVADAPALTDASAGVSQQTATAADAEADAPTATLAAQLAQITAAASEAAADAPTDTIGFALRQLVAAVSEAVAHAPTATAFLVSLLAQLTAATATAVADAPTATGYLMGGAGVAELLGEVSLDPVLAGTPELAAVLEAAQQLMAALEADEALEMVLEGTVQTKGVLDGE